jgi:DinB family protein
MDKQLIEHYAAGGEQLSLAIRGLTPEDLISVPAPDANVGRWSIQQVVVHLMDSDLIATDRMKRMIAEDNPTLIGYNENKFTENLFYHDQPAEQAVQILDLNRKLFAQVLLRLPASAWQRKGTHNERGVITAGSYLKSTVDHLDHHLKFIHKKRAHMGKEMW